MAKFIFSAFADEYSSDIDVQVKALSENGFSAIEPRNVSGTNISSLSDTEVNDLKEKVLSHGLKFSSLGSPLGKIKITDEFAPHLELTERTCKIAQDLGCKNVRMFSFFIPHGEKPEKYRDEVLCRLGAMLDVAEKYGVTLCHENEFDIYGETPERCLDILKHFNGRLKTVFDMGNFALCGCDAWSAYLTLKDYIEYFHIKDGTKLKEIVPPGLGEGKIKEILADYSTKNNNLIYITLEPHLLTFDGLKSLTDNTFSYPYPYQTAEDAFLDAFDRLKKLI